MYCAVTIFRLCWVAQEESPEEKARQQMRSKMRRLKWQLRTQKFMNEVFGTVYKKVRVVEHSNRKALS